MLTTRHRLELDVVWMVLAFETRFSIRRKRDSRCGGNAPKKTFKIKHLAKTFLGESRLEVLGCWSE